MNRPVQIFGARNSGTTWIFNYLKNNKVHVISGLKHANLDTDQVESFYTEGQIKTWRLDENARLDNIKVILIGRNIFNWLKSMHKKPYSTQIKNRNFNDFIRSPFTSNLEEPPYTVNKPLELNPAKTPIELRSIKYSNWFRFLDNDKYDFLYINYDKILLNPKRYTDIISTFINKNLNKINPTQNKIKDSFYNNQQLIKKHFTKEQTEFILNNCLKDIENKMEFDYSNILELY